MWFDSRADLVVIVGASVVELSFWRLCVLGGDARVWGNGLLRESSGTSDFQLDSEP